MRKIPSKLRYAFLYALLLPLAGCMAEVSSPESESDALGLAISPERIVNSRGHEFRRKDLWDPAELGAIEDNARRAVLVDTATLEEVADGLRGQMIGPGGRIYVESVPNLELARSFLADMQTSSITAGTQPEGALADLRESGGPGASEPRRVFGADTRNNSSSTTGWQAAMGFQEQGASGARIGQHTMVTAAHNLYSPPAVGDEGWYCRDGSVGFSGCSAYPRWRFGVNGTSGHSNWIAIGTSATCTAYVSTSFMVLESGTWTFAKYDYAVLDLSGCSANLFPNGWVWIGFDAMTNSELAALHGYTAGYPGRAPCPDLSDGTAGDCPGATNQYSGSWPNFTGAELFTAGSTSINAGDSEKAYTIKTTLDTTSGQSGGPMYKITSSGDHLLVGWLSNNGASINRYRRWTSGMYDWVSDRSLFPDDR